MNIGDAFLLTTKGINDHPQVVISDPGQNSEELVVVSLTSYNTISNESRKDGSCILQPGDHPWIKHTTCVSYRDGRIVSEGRLDAMLAARQIELLEPVTDPILTRIIEGAENTEELPNKCKALLEDQRLIQG